MIKLTPEQQAVVDAPTADILVSAAAGSGKTAVLVERILKMVLRSEDPVDIDEILIVTFTNDAAAQMRDKIRRAIDDRLIKDPQNKRLQRQSERVSFASIMTLDSFCQSVVKRYFHCLNIDPNFRVLDDTDRNLLWSRAVMETIEAKHEEGDEAFFDMLEMYSGSKDDGKLIDLITELDNFSQSAPFPEEWITGAAERLLRIKTEEDLLNSDYALSEYDILRNMFGSFAASAERLYQLCVMPDGPAFYADGIANDFLFCTGMRDAASFGEMLKRISDYYGSNTRIGVKPKKTNVSQELSEYVMEKRKALKECFDKWVKQYASDDALPMITEKVRQCANPVKTLCDLTVLCRRAYRELMDAQNAYDFSEIAHMTLQILVEKTEDGYAYTDAAKQYRMAFREIMVDEYQDSNYVQEMFLQAVSGKEDGRPNIFMVGDVKQSIYKFRMAKPELFVEKYNRFRQEKDSPERLLILNRNFRSRATILEGINRVCRKIMQREIGGVTYDEKASLYPGAEYAVPFTEDEAAIEYLLIEKDRFPDPTEAMTAAIVRRVRELTDPVSGLRVSDGEGWHTARYGDIAILCKKSTALMFPVIDALLAAGIPAYAADLKGYFDCTEVRNVLNMLKILDNPYEDIPFQAVLKSPMGGFDYEDLALLAIYKREYAEDGRTDYTIDLLRRLAEAEFVTKAMRPVKKNAVRFLGLYDSLCAKCVYLSVPELLTGLYRETGYLSYVSLMPAGSVRERNLRVLVEKAKAFAGGTYTELSDFVRYIDDMKKYDIHAEGETADGGNAIRVMTIHKSKGLEYPVVFVPDMERRLAFGSENSVIRMHDELGLGPKAISVRGRYRSKSFAFQSVEHRNRIDDRGEALRLLYVAMTRAKEKLILVGSCTDREYEKICENLPEKGEKLGFDAVLSAESYQNLLLPAILSEAEERNSEVIRAEEWKLVRISEEATAGIAEAGQEKEEKAPEEPDFSLLREFFSYRYPFQTDRIPVKVSVSALKKSAMEEYAANPSHPGIPEFTEQKEEIPVPRFAGGEQSEAVPAGAMRGTWYHRFLELHDYQKDDSPEALMEEAFEMVRSGVVPKEMPEALSFKKLSAFFRSDIGRRMKNAALSGNLKREQAFVMSVSADRVDGTFDPKETVLVQGIIDAMFEEEDGIVLLDYKTDRVDEMDGERILKARYEAQLKYYAEAISRGTGKNVKESCIYSFGLQKSIEL